MSRHKDIFYFKEFAVKHNRSSMRVGTDAVLLGAWVNTPHTGSILDIGTGSGVIALMLAQRTKPEIKIDAIDINKDDADQAAENVAASKWPSKIAVHNQALQEFKTHIKYELIISNPPFFINSHLPPSSKRTTARHTTSLTYSDILNHTLRLLSPSGRLAIILPSEEGNLFRDQAKHLNMFCIRQLAFFSRQGKPQERWLMEFSLINSPLRQETLYLHGQGESWSDEYVNLTRNFYLKI